MKAIVLAAGKGTRLSVLGTDLPKTMHQVKGRPIFEYVMDTLNFLDTDDVTVIVKYRKEKIIESYPGLHYVEQGDDGYGTGYAVDCAYDRFKDYDGDVIVICGDTPLITQSTVKKMIEMHNTEGNACTILSCEGEEGLALGRIVRDENGKLISIVEHKDCTDEQRKICEYNAATYIFNCKKMFDALKEVENSRATGEKYLTDVPAIMLANNEKVNAYMSKNSYEILGINSPNDLKIVEEVLENIL